jgi:hypothetical protein
VICFAPRIRDQQVHAALLRVSRGLGPNRNRLLVLDAQSVGWFGLGASAARRGHWFCVRGATPRTNCNWQERLGPSRSGLARRGSARFGIAWQAFLGAAACVEGGFDGVW